MEQKFLQACEIAIFRMVSELYGATCEQLRWQWHVLYKLVARKSPQQAQYAKHRGQTYGS